MKIRECKMCEKPRERILYLEDISQLLKSEIDMLKNMIYDHVKENTDHGSE